MPVKKPDGWKEDLDASIKEGKSYAEVVNELTTKYGDEGSVGESTYGKMKKIAFPEEERSDVIEDLKEIKTTHAKKKKIKSLPPWSSSKQKIADDSQLAKVINQTLFVVIPCPSGEMTEEDFLEINLGGGIVGTITYVFPHLDLMNNAIIIMSIRAGLLIIKVRKICNKIKSKFGNETIGSPDGLNPDYPVEEPTPLKNSLVSTMSNHPLDSPELSKLWKDEG